MSPDTLIRRLCVAATAACVLAVFVARCQPRGSAFRVRSTPHLGAVGGAFLSPGGGPTRVLDAATGRLSVLPVPPGDSLEWPAFSVWADSRGRRQAVGRWVAMRGASPNRVASGTGLARLSYPDGRVLDRVEDCPVPASPPCWYPGPEPRVLYASLDGRLYRCTFGGRDGPEVRPITWRSRGAGRGEPFVSGVLWPEAPALRGRALAVVRRRFPGSRLGPSEIWWLELDGGGDEVRGAGPLAAGGRGADAEWRAPAVAPGPAGDWLIAWVRSDESSSLGELRVAPLRADAESGEPCVTGGESRAVAPHVLGTPPVFSPDGAYIYAVQAEPGRAAAVRRFAVRGR
jgi:hypothetical protein